MLDIFVKALLCGLGLGASAVVLIAILAFVSEVGRWWRMRGFYREHKDLQEKTWWETERRG